MSKIAKDRPETVGESVGCLVVTKVIREFVPITRPRDGYGETLGQIIDAHLDECARRQEEVQEIKLNIDEMYWTERVRAQRT